MWARVSYSSQSQTGCFAVALAGLAVTVSTLATLPEGLVWMGEADGLPILPNTRLFLARGAAAEGSPAVTEPVAILKEMGYFRRTWTLSTILTSSNWLARRP